MTDPEDGATRNIGGDEGYYFEPGDCTESPSDDDDQPHDFPHQHMRPDESVAGARTGCGPRNAWRMGIPVSSYFWTFAG